MMNNLLELFVLKMVDTIINSGKTIFLIRGQKFLSALSQAISNVFYIILMSKLMKATDMPSILTTSLAMFVGQYMSQWVAERFNKAKVYKISATAKTRELGEVAIDSLAEQGLNFRVLKAEGKKSKAYAIDIFCPTKEETKIAKEILISYNLKFYTMELKAIND